MSEQHADREPGWYITDRAHGDAVQRGPYKYVETAGKVREEMESAWNDYGGAREDARNLSVVWLPYDSELPATPVPAPLDMRRVRAALAACEGVPTERLTPGCLLRLRNSVSDLLPHAETDVSRLTAIMIGSLYPSINAAKLDRARRALGETDPIIPPGVGGIDLGGMDDAE